MYKLYSLIFFVTFSLSCTTRSENESYKKNNLFLTEDSVVVDTLSVDLLDKFKFYNRSEIQSLLKPETMNYKYGVCGMGIIDMNNKSNKVLQFLSYEQPTLPNLKNTNLENTFTFPQELEYPKGVEIKIISTSIEIDTISTPKNVIMNFAFIDMGSSDTIGYQWTKLFEWKRLGTTVITFRNSNDYVELKKAMETVTEAHNIL